MYALVFMYVYICDVSHTLQHPKLLRVSQDKSEHKPRFQVTHMQGSAGQVDLIACLTKEGKRVFWAGLFCPVSLWDLVEGKEQEHEGRSGQA